VALALHTLAYRLNSSLCPPCMLRSFNTESKHTVNQNKEQVVVSITFTHKLNTLTQCAELHRAPCTVHSAHQTSVAPYLRECCCCYFAHRRDCPR
jgi:hypothetical protein